MLMEDKYNWNLKDIFKEEEDFTNAIKKLNINLLEMESYQGNLISAENIFKCYNLYEKSLELYEKIYSYGMLKYHLDMADTSNIKLYKKVEDIRNRI